MKLEQIFEIDTNDILEGRTTDNRGRVMLGREHANKEVDVVIVNRRPLDDE